jgi:3-hydroxyisobutyrate dehydrogenase
MNVGILGTGTMGSAVAKRLLGAGHNVTVWNRTPEKAGSLVGVGAKLAETPRAAAAGVDVLITLVADGPAVESVMGGEDGALAAMRTGAAWLQMATVGMDATPRLARLSDQKGVYFLDAPLLGTREPAEKGELTVIVAGPEELRDRLSPIFNAISTRVVWMDRIGEPSRLKLAVDAVIVGFASVLGESVALARALRLDPQALLGLLEESALDAPFVRSKTSAMVRSDFAPSFSLELALKDVRLILDAGRTHELDLLVTSAVADLLARAAKRGVDLDVSAAVLGVRRG